MKDILGREIKDYDLVVGKGTGENAHKMSVGLWIGKSLVTSSYSKRSMSDVYLIENPSEMELEIKSKIIKELKEAEKAKEEKKKIKCISLRNMETGGIYEDINGDYWLYFGKCNVTIDKNYISARAWAEHSHKSGHCFVEVFDKFIQSKKSEDLNEFFVREISVLKGNKKLVKLVDKVNLEKEICFKYDGYGYTPNETIVIERIK